jgi:glycosyltransferase involved in cell wall biosynthesis
VRIALLTTDGRDLWRDYDTPAPHFGSAPEALLQGFALLQSIEVHVVSCVRAKVNAPPKLAPNIFFHSLRVPKIGWLRTGYQGCIRAVRSKLKEIQPDLVHGQGTERDCAISAVFSGFPNVITIHGNMRTVARVSRARPFSAFWLAARLETLILPRSSGVVCITQHTRQAVMGLARRTWIVPNAVDASFFEINAQPAQGALAHILCVANICKLKNQHALIHALEPLAERLRLELRFCGATDPRDPYSQEFLRLVEARPWCVYSGVATREELRGFLRQSNTLVLPSLEENCPMAVLEAMAAGVPVIASRVGGLPELIEEGQTGFFCDPLQAASIAGAIEQVLAHPAAAAAVARQARQHARERFQPTAIARRHLEIYAEVLQSGTLISGCPPRLLRTRNSFEAPLTRSGPNQPASARKSR